MKKLNKTRKNKKNKINIQFEIPKKKNPVPAKIIRTVILKAMAIKDVQGCEFSIIFCDNDKIHKLNKKYRKIDTPTDVLSFHINKNNPENGLFLLGDVVISIDKIHEQSEKYNCAFKLELFRLAIHGMLHLLGSEDETEEQYIEMKKELDSIIKKLKKNNYL